MCSLVEIGRLCRGVYCLHNQGPNDGGNKHVEKSVSFYQTTRRNIPEDSHLHTLRLGNLKSHPYTALNSICSLGLGQCTPATTSHWHWSRVSAAVCCVSPSLCYGDAIELGVYLFSMIGRCQWNDTFAGDSRVTVE
jgi:hypothetical protein